MRTRHCFLFSILVVLLFCGSTAFVGERTVTIGFSGYAGQLPLLEGKNYFCSPKNDSISVSMCRFYISEVELLSGTTVIGRMRCHIVDLFDSTTTQIKIAAGNEKITGLNFNLGIDSLTNVSGVGEGELDPTKGMYWAWQSGYINLKLEGKSAQCTATRGEFNYHLGGYLGSNYCMRRVELKATSDNLHVGVDVMRFFSPIDMHECSRVMSPGPKAVELSGHAAKMFFVVQ